MKNLSLEEKSLIFGGFAKSLKKATFSKPKTTRKASSLTTWNNRFFSIGQAVIAAASVFEHLNSSVPKLVSVIDNDEEGYISLKNNKENYQLRPRFSFGRDYWNSSISYGTSWYF